MTKEEAIKWLRDIANDPLTIDPEVDAISMAIKALKQPECENVSDTNVGKMCEYYDLCRNGRDEEKLKADLGLNLCEDAVSRKAAISELPYLLDYEGFRGESGYVSKNLVRTMLKGLPSVTPKQERWIYIEEELPKTIINTHTHDYQEYICLCDFGDNGFDVRTYKFGYGHFWNGGGIVDKYVTAWQPLPEIPDALKPQPMEGKEQ